MSYETVANALETLLEAVTDFGSARVSQFDYSILNAGVKRAIVIRSNGWSRELTRFGGPYETTYDLGIELFAKYTKPADTENQLRDDMQLIIDKLDANPELNGTANVINAFISEVDQVSEPPEGLVSPPGVWRMWQLHCMVTETGSTSHAE